MLKRIISKMSNVSVKTFERLLQITTILGRATEDDTKLSSNITVKPASFFYFKWGREN